MASVGTYSVSEAALGLTSVGSGSDDREPAVPPGAPGTPPATAPVAANSGSTGSLAGPGSGAGAGSLLVVLSSAVLEPPGALVLITDPGDGGPVVHVAHEPGDQPD